MSDKGEYFLILPQLTRERAKEIADEAYSGSLMWHENKAYPYDNECAAIITKENPEIQLSQYKRERDEARRLLEVSACPSNCDDGAIPHGPDPDGNWKAEQCQFCYEREQALKDTDNDS